MIKWDDFRFLAAVQKTGSISRAAREAQADPSTVSRRLGQLANSLNIELLVKTREGWQINPAARMLAEEALEFQNRVEHAVHALQAQSGEIAGEISLAAPPTVCSHVLLPDLGRFLRDNPAVAMSLHRRMSDALGEDDIIVTQTRPMRGRLMVRPLGHLVMAIYTYDPKATGDRWIGLVRDHDSTDAGAWSRTQFEKPPLHRLKTFPEILELMRATRLPGILPGIIARDEPDLVPLFPDRPPLRVNLYLCFHETRRHDPVVASVADWLSETIGRRADNETLVTTLA